MAAKKRRSARTKTRTVYRAAPRRSYRRKNTLNASCKKKTAALGTAIGLGAVALPIAINAVQTRSLTPVTAAFTNKDKLMEMGKNAIVGYAVGYGAGVVFDKTGLKKPINKVIKKVGL